MWFEFKQNNSGGSFEVNEYVTNHLLIEADSEEEAIEIAESKGVYFNGCEMGMDCSCCGDRWYTPNTVDLPYQYGALIESEANEIAEKYNGEVVDTKYLMPHSSYFKERNKDVIFNTIESYVQYMSDKWGWCSPDSYIYYKDGRKIEIYCNSDRQIHQTRVLK